ncbi:MAG: outer membrane protein assembly factor BamB [Escherichia coli]|nr:outer membrane protein assembly factor BamB [Escherichia coli]
MQLRKLLLPGLLSVTLLSGCSLFNSEEDVVKMSPLPTVENQFTPTTAWSTSVGSGIGNFYSNLHPALADNVVYAADRAGFEKAQVYALNTSDGTVAWQTKVAGEALSRPVVSDGLVLIHTSNGQLQALNEADGAVKWTVNLDMPSLSLRGESAPATAFGAAVVGGDNGRVSAVLMEQGQMIWQQRISQATGSTEIDRLSDVDTTPVVVNGVVFALAYNGNLTALDLRSGQIMWKRELGSVNDFIVDGNRIYLVDQNDRVMALTIDGGVTLWTQSDLLHRLLTSPVLYNGNLVVGDSEGYLHWINVEDGRFVAQQKVDSSGFQTEPVAADGKLLIQAKDGTVYSITR